MSPSGASSELNALAMQRLNRALGPAAAPRAAQEALAELGVAELTSADELLDFAEHLIAKGGVYEAVGRALKISALLRGADDELASP